MTDFVLPAPGTTINPYTPAGTTSFWNGMSSAALGIHGHSGAGAGVFADSRQYGPVIDISATMAQVNAGGDDWYLGVVILGGANAGAMIGLYVQSVSAILGSMTSLAATKTNISSTSSPITAAANDVFSLRLSLSVGVWTFSNVTQNGSAISLVGPTTSTTFGSETQFSAGWGLVCGNTNNTYFSQVTGNGVAPPSNTLGAGYQCSPGISSPC